MGVGPRVGLFIAACFAAMAVTSAYLPLWFADRGLTAAEIGQVLGVTESRICQMHTKAVLQLRGKLADQKD